MRSRRLAVAAAAVGFLLTCGVGVASAISIDTGRIAGAARLVSAHRVGDTAEAWYAPPSGSVCLPLVGCLPLPLPLPLSTYPAGTLHVGETLGVESARAYVVPDLPADRAKLPASGTLVLPLDSSQLAGTLDLGSSRIKACLTTGHVPSQASAKSMTTGAPPSVDCTVSSPARYDASIHAFRVDLAPFLAKWRHGRPDRGIALLPGVAGGAGLADWGVAFDGKGAASATIYSLLSKAAPQQTAPTGTPSTGTGNGTPAPVTIPPSAVTLPGGTTVTAPVAPPAIAPQPQAAVYFVRSTRFRYPAIFIAPLAILAGAIFFARLFTATTIRPRSKTLYQSEKGS